MSEFRMERGFRQVYIGNSADGDDQGSVQRSPVVTHQLFNTRGPASAGVPQYKMGPPTYRTGVYLERDNTRPPRPIPTVLRSADPTHSSSQRSQIVYHVQEALQSPSRESNSPQIYAQPRAQLVIGRGGSPSRLYSAVYNSESAAVPTDENNAQAPQSPYQERNDVETLVPMYTASYPDKYPSGAPSRIVYSAHISPQGHVSPRGPREGYDADSSHDKQGSGQQHSPQTVTSQGDSSPRSPLDTPFRPLMTKSDTSSASPRPYQLKPTMDSGTGLTKRSSAGTGKEAEVDALTDLLIQNMEVSGDPDFFGMCVKCGRAIMGDNQGCSALDQLFHKDCFSCSSCGMGLKGYQFFAMEGKPYCEPCYMNTLEKCSVCSKVITDRILRATGKPYHPDCFMCVVCGKSLDGVQFTVDATNQIHCIEDFHKKFAPRCCVCNGPIIPEKGEVETVRLVAMDQSFHVKCYKCEDCGLLLSSETDGRGCYPLDNHILCKQCNAKRIQSMTTRMMTEL